MKSSTRSLVRGLAALVLGVSALSSHAQEKVEIFVKWRSDSASERQALQRDLGLSEVWKSSLVSGLNGYSLEKSSDRAQLLSVLSKDRRVVYAEPNYKVHRVLPSMGRIYSGDELKASRTTEAPNDPMLSRQWAMTTEKGVHAIEAWEHTSGSKDIRVAVIDTGVSATHPDLADRVVAGYDFIDNTANVIDSHGHGTHVAGIIGAVSNNGVGVAGINPNVSIIPIRAVPGDGDETDANVIASFEFAVKNGARVANCSFGKAEASMAVGETIEAAGQAGLLTVVAAGNDGADNNLHAAFPANFKTSNMIVVASTTQSGGLSFFSNYGLNMVDVAAPGSSILSTVINNGYSAFSGTSMASPMVAGVAALTLSVNPDLTVAQLKEILLTSAAKDALLSGKITTGARIDAKMAVNAARKLLVTTENP